MYSNRLLLALGGRADDVGVARVGDGQRRDTVEFTAGGAEVHVVCRKKGRSKGDPKVPVY